MAENTKIEWAHHTFNPWIGCTRISPACDHCYAARIDHRFGGGHWGVGQPRKRTKPANWNFPHRWNRIAEKTGVRPRVFCASLADVFDKEVPEKWRADLFDLIRETPSLDWLLLTKRIGNVTQLLNQLSDYACKQNDESLMRWIEAWADGDSVPHNIWLGATVVNQDEAERDIPKLLGTPAAVRFLSIEPMLGPISLSYCNSPYERHQRWAGAYSPLNGSWWPAVGDPDEEAAGAEEGLAAIDWIIAGGESGPEARPSNPDLFRSLRDQCAEAGVPFLFKQWGEWAPKRKSQPEDMLNDSWAMDRVGKKQAGRDLDGRTWDGVPR